MTLDEVVGQLIEEARGNADLAAAAEQPPLASPGQIEALTGAGDADVTKAPLLLLAALLECAHVREDPLLHADHEDDVVLEALGVVEGHQGHQRLLAAQVVLL